MRVRVRVKVEATAKASYISKSNSQQWRRRLVSVIDASAGRAGVRPMSCAMCVAGGGALGQAGRKVFSYMGRRDMAAAAELAVTRRR